MLTHGNALGIQKDADPAALRAEVYNADKVFRLPRALLRHIFLDNTTSSTPPEEGAQLHHRGPILSQ